MLWRFAIPVSIKGTPQKPNEYPFKNDAWKTAFLLKWSFYRRHVNFGKILSSANICNNK